MNETFSASPGGTLPSTTYTGEVQNAGPPALLLDHKILYHGSATSGISEMNMAQETTVGCGVYFVDNPVQAVGYARIRAGDKHSQSPVMYEVEVSNIRLVNLSNPDKLLEIMQGFVAALRRMDLSQLSWIH